MGSVCSKEGIKPPLKSPSLKAVVAGGYRMSGVEFKTKQLFQKEYEERNYEQDIDLSPIWGVSIANYDIRKVYLFDKETIGSGHYGVVRRARLISEPTKVYAIKTVGKKKLKGDTLLLKNELDLLRVTEHPNIIQFYEIYQDENFVHFVMECCTGGDVTSLLEAQGGLTEERAKQIIFETLLAVNYLHKLGICHRDIKPDNFLFKDKSEKSSVKVIDFGLSKRLPKGEKLKSLLGTPYYVAPELIENKGYGFKADIWSIGVMLYLLFLAEFPFKGEKQQEIFENIRSGRYNITKLKKFTPEAIKFLARCLTIDEKTRPTAAEALRDPWFRDIDQALMDQGKKHINKELLESLLKFRSESMFGKEVIRILVMIHDYAPEIVKLKEAFYYLDIMNDGVVEKQELFKVFKENGIEFSNEDAENLIEALEMRTKGVITYLEFLTAAVDEDFYQNDKYLKEAFNRFDITGDGKITVDDLTEAFKRFGLSVSNDEILQYIQQFDLDKDQKIGIDDFLKMMKKDFHPMSDTK